MQTIHINKKASFEYFIEDKLECGIVLTGTEIKSLRDKKCNLDGSYVDVASGEVFLIGMHIAKYENGNLFNHEEKRDRKLLLHKDEIRKFKEWKQDKGHTLIPLEVYFKYGKAKVIVGFARGKKLYDKRESIKKKDLEREKQQIFKDSIK